MLRWNDSSVRGGHFKWDLNLNKDPADMDRDPRTIYPLASDEYEVTVTFDDRPRGERADPQTPRTPAQVSPPAEPGGEKT